MANDKDFLLKNAVEVGGPTNVTLGTVISDNIDLSTGNYFKDTPTGTSTYTISNAGDVQSFQLEVTGGTEEVAQNFSTTLYTGTSATQTITNNIDLSNDGGLVWIKRRDTSQDHWLFDSERNNFDNKLSTNLTDAEIDTSSYPYDLDPTSSGFIVNGSASNTNLSGATYASWTFKKAAGFFDVVEYNSTSGNTTNFGSAGATVDHNLGSVPGMIIVKCTDTAATNWKVYHRGLNGGTTPEQYEIELNQTGAEANSATSWNDTAPTSTQFTLGASGDVNNGSRSYVAYLFAHDTAADSLIKCGSYTGGGSSAPPTIDLGFEPQWVLVKSSSVSGTHWYIVDSMRGLVVGSDDAYLTPSANDAEGTAPFIEPTATGFEVAAVNSSYINGSGQTYIYIAIRAASDLDITWPSSIEWAGGVAPAAPATGETDLFTITTDDGGTTYTGVKTADNLS